MCEAPQAPTLMTSSGSNFVLRYTEIRVHSSMQPLRVQTRRFIAYSKQQSTPRFTPAINTALHSPTHPRPPLSTVFAKSLTTTTTTTMAPERPQPRNKLQQLFPNTKLPVIISAPMLGVSNGALAAQVSKAGGLGTIPGGYDLAPGSAHLRALEADLRAARAALGLSELTLTPAPLGVGFVTCHPSVARFREAALPILERYLPQAVWLFAPDPGPEGAPRAHPDVIEACHDRGVKVFVQVGTVAAAREAVSDGADIIVAQGVDAGGHQFAAGAGVVSLVPEIRTMLDEEFAGKDVALVAAGGISDPSAVVAAIALGEFLCALLGRVCVKVTNGCLLGADGVVMGTKVSFLRWALSQCNRKPKDRI